jgi:hypothetical protein
MRGLARSLAFFTTLITAFLAIDVIVGLYSPFQRLNQTAPGQLPSQYVFWGIPLLIAVVSFLAARELARAGSRRSLLFGALFALGVTVGLAVMIAVEGSFFATCANPGSQDLCYFVPPGSQDPDYYFLYGSVVLWAAGIFFSVLTCGTALGVALMGTRALRQI